MAYRVAAALLALTLVALPPMQPATAKQVPYDPNCVKAYLSVWARHPRVLGLGTVLRMIAQECPVYTYPGIDDVRGYP